MSSPAEHELLRAEALAFPFASRAAHELCVLRLAAPRGVPDGPTARLLRAFEDRIRPLAQGLALDRVRAIARVEWLGPSAEGARSLVDVLARAAAAIELRGGAPILRRGEDGEARVRAYRWLSLALPADLLVASRYAGATPASSRELDVVTSDAPAGTSRSLEHRTPIGNVDLASEEVRALCVLGVADTHLHVGAAFSFDLLWAGLARGLATSPPTPAELDREGPPPFARGEEFLRMLLAAAIARLLLGVFVARRRAGETFATFEESGLVELAESVSWASGPRSLQRMLRDVLELLVAGRGRTRTAVLLAVYRKLVARAALDPLAPRPTTPAEVARADPLARWFPAARATPELGFATRALGYAGGEGAHDERFARAFWQYERVRCATFRHVAQEPGVVGLDWFLRHFRRLGPLRRQLDRAVFASALEHQGRGVELVALEARTTPEARWFENARNVRDLARDAARAGREAALVLHFLKDDAASTRAPVGHGAEEAIRLGDPRDPVFGSRFGRWASARRRELRALKTMLERVPETLVLFRAMDVAAGELAQPLWPLVGVLRELRQASFRAAARLAAKRPSWGVGPLRTTVHVGEDVRRLVDGLRRVHELVEHGVVGPGDRLGHGLALGTNARAWVEANPIVVEPREERLDDLLWELERIARDDLELPRGRRERTRAEATEHARAIYDDADLASLIEARARRHRLAEHPVFAAYPSLRSPSVALARRGRGAWDAADRLVDRYLSEPAVFDRGQELVEIRADEDEAGALEAMQLLLRRRLASLGITIESNPSSNLLIGNLGALEHHPALALAPPGPSTRAADEARLEVSLNVDDPITFASSLADEYVYVHAALRRLDVGEEDALRWLDDARRAGLRSRFSLPASRDPDVLEEVTRAIAGPSARFSRGPRQSS